MTIRRGMTIMEINVLNAIKNSASYDLPIQASEPREHFGLKKRMLEKIIESLRVTFKQPIVAKKCVRAVIIFHELRRNKIQD